MTQLDLLAPASPAEPQGHGADIVIDWPEACGVAGLCAGYPDACAGRWHWVAVSVRQVREDGVGRPAMRLEGAAADVVRANTALTAALAEITAAMTVPVAPQTPPEDDIEEHPEPAPTAKKRSTRRAP